MNLREYIERATGNAATRANPYIRRIAMMSQSSDETVYSIVIGRRHASRQLAERIHRATDGHVKPNEVMRDR